MPAPLVAIIISGFVSFVWPGAHTGEWKKSESIFTPRLPSDLDGLATAPELRPDPRPEDHYAQLAGCEADSCGKRP